MMRMPIQQHRACAQARSQRFEGWPQLGQGVQQHDRLKVAMQVEHDVRIGC